MIFFLIYSCDYQSVLLTTTMPVTRSTTFSKCNKVVSRSNLARHMKSHNSGRKHCPKCPFFTCTNQRELDFHVSKRHSDDMDNRITCGTCHESFSLYFSLNQNKRLIHNTTPSKKLDNDWLISTRRDLW